MKNNHDDKMRLDFHEEFSTDFDAKLFAVPNYCLNDVCLNENKWREIAQACREQTYGEKKAEKKRVNRYAKVLAPIAAVLVAGIGVMRLSMPHMKDEALQGDMMLLPAAEAYDSAGAGDAQDDLAPVFEKQESGAVIAPDAGETSLAVDEENAALPAENTVAAPVEPQPGVESESIAGADRATDTGDVVAKAGEKAVTSGYGAQGTVPVEMEERPVVSAGSASVAATPPARDESEQTAAIIAPRANKAPKSMSFDPLSGILPDDFRWNGAQEDDHYTVYLYERQDGGLLEVTIWHDGASSAGIAITGEEIANSVLYDELADGRYQMGWIEKGMAARLVLAGKPAESGKEELLAWTVALKERMTS